MRWKIGIALGLGLVICVNIAFAWVAVKNQPQIETSYVETAR